MVLVVTGMIAPGATAATIGVNSTAMDAADDGTCTLVEAINAANTDSASGSLPGECSAGDGADVIELQAAAMYRLTAVDNTLNGDNGLPPITSEVAIQGNGAIIERLPNAPAMRIVYVGGTGALALSHVTIRGGNQASGSAIHSEGGPLELTHTTVVQNVGDAIDVEQAPLTMNNVTVSSTHNGTGLTAELDDHPVQIELSEIVGNGATGVRIRDGLVTITDSEISYNGDGVWLFGGVFEIARSTIAHNNSYGLSLYPGAGGEGASGKLSRSALHDNGGYALNGYIAGTVTVVNTTIAHNDNEGAVLELGTYDIVNSTIVGNHYVGLVRWSAIVNLKNTIIANTQSGVDCMDEFPSPPYVINSLGHNLDGDGTCNLTEPTDLPGVDPTLDELAFNCGYTKNCAPSSGSPAIDVADTAACLADPVDGVDQRGFPRPSDGDLNGSIVCDIGAFEVHLPDYDQDGIPEDGDGSCTAGDGPCTGGQTTDCDDNCASDWNPGQEDEDRDGIGSACDNCPAVLNPSQSDGDADGEGDHCDLDDGFVYLSFSQWDLVEWQDEVGVDAYNLYKSDLDVLRATGVYTQEPGSNPVAGQQCGVTDPYAPDSYVPLPGKVALYLLAPVVGGVEGSLGQDSEGVERPNDHPCPGTMVGP